MQSFIMNEYMLKNDTPVVFGLYFTKSDPSEPLVYRGGAPRELLSLIAGSIVFSTLGLCGAVAYAWFLWARPRGTHNQA